MQGLRDQIAAQEKAQMDKDKAKIAEQRRLSSDYYEQIMNTNLYPNLYMNKFGQGRRVKDRVYWTNTSSGTNVSGDYGLYNSISGC